MKNDMRSERTQYVERVQELLEKIESLEQMNTELIYKDFNFGQLEQELKKFQEMLRTSKSNEQMLQSQIMECKKRENYLEGETKELETKLEAVYIRMRSERKNVNAIETKLQKSNAKWLDFTRDDKISKFVLKDENTAQRFTGLNYSARNHLWDFLGPAKYELPMWKRTCLSGHLKSMCVEDQFLLTLVILRKGWDYCEVATIFDLDQQIVSSTFKTWLQFMYCQFKEMEEVLFTKAKDIDKETIPKCFQKTKEFQNVRCVIDCTEIFIESSR